MLPAGSNQLSDGCEAVAQWLTNLACTQAQSQGAQPSVQDLAAHQQILAQQVQRLAVELSKRRSSRKSDGDHALLSRKPALTGYTCVHTAIRQHG